jgi:hypothetical protein
MVMDRSTTIKRLGQHEDEFAGDKLQIAQQQKLIADVEESNA